MFVYSLRAQSLKFFGVAALALAALICIIVFVPTYSPASSETASLASDSAKEITFDKIKTNDDRVNFLSQFGWTVAETPVEEAEITIPDEFDRVFTGYNELQKQQGLNLEKYRRREMKRYTYEITNYPGYTGTVYANLLVYRNKVVGGDVCSADSNGFIHGFSRGTVI